MNLHFKTFSATEHRIIRDKVDLVYKNLPINQTCYQDKTSFSENKHTGIINQNKIRQIKNIPELIILNFLIMYA